MVILEVSIIILTKNEERFIEETLKAVFSQEAGYNFEVIVIDSGSQDRTLEIAARYPVKIINIDSIEFGHGRTRNYGAKVASGKIVVFLNADATPIGQYWLKNMIDDLKSDQEISGVYSRIYPRPDCNPLRSWEILNEETNVREVKCIADFDNYQYMKPRNKRKFLAFQSISCAIKKEFLLEYPFEDIQFGEDLEWSKRIIEKGFKIVFEPKSMVLHSHNFYCSFIKTFKKYFDDSGLNNRLLNIWSWNNLPVLAAHIIYKMLKDSSYILSLNEGIAYKIAWMFYSPIIRMAELFGIMAGITSRHLPHRLRSAFSLVNEVQTDRI